MPGKSKTSKAPMNTAPMKEAKATVVEKKTNGTASAAVCPSKCSSSAQNGTHKTPPQLYLGDVWALWPEDLCATAYGTPASPLGPGPAETASAEEMTAAGPGGAVIAPSPTAIVGTLDQFVEHWTTELQRMETTHSNNDSRSSSSTSSSSCRCSLLKYSTADESPVVLANSAALAAGMGQWTMAVEGISNIQQAATNMTDVSLAIVGGDYFGAKQSSVLGACFELSVAASSLPSQKKKQQQVQPLSTTLTIQLFTSEVYICEEVQDALADLVSPKQEEENNSKKNSRQQQGTATNSSGSGSASFACLNRRRTVRSASTSTAGLSASSGSRTDSARPKTGSPGSGNSGNNRSAAQNNGNGKTTVVIGERRAPPTPPVLTPRDPVEEKRIAELVEKVGVATASCDQQLSVLRQLIQDDAALKKQHSKFYYPSLEGDASSTSWADHDPDEETVLAKAQQEDTSSSSASSSVYDYGIATSEFFTQGGAKDELSIQRFLGQLKQEEHASSAVIARVTRAHDVIKLHVDEDMLRGSLTLQERHHYQSFAKGWKAELEAVKQRLQEAAEKEKKEEAEKKKKAAAPTASAPASKSNSNSRSDEESSSSKKKASTLAGVGDDKPKPTPSNTKNATAASSLPGASSSATATPSGSPSGGGKKKKKSDTAAADDDEVEEKGNPAEEEVQQTALPVPPPSPPSTAASGGKKQQRNAPAGEPAPAGKKKKEKETKQQQQSSQSSLSLKTSNGSGASSLQSEMPTSTSTSSKQASGEGKSETAVVKEKGDESVGGRNKKAKRETPPPQSQSQSQQQSSLAAEAQQDGSNTGSLRRRETAAAKKPERDEEKTTKEKKKDIGAANKKGTAGNNSKKNTAETAAADRRRQLQQKNAKVTLIAVSIFLTLFLALCLTAIYA